MPSWISHGIFTARIEICCYSLVMNHHSPLPHRPQCHRFHRLQEPHDFPIHTPIRRLIGTAANRPHCPASTDTAYERLLSPGESDPGRLFAPFLAWIDAIHHRSTNGSVARRCRPACAALLRKRDSPSRTIYGIPHRFKVTTGTLAAFAAATLPASTAGPVQFTE